MTSEPTRFGHLTGGRLVVALVLVAVLLVTGGFVAGRLAAPTQSFPSTTSAAAGFARDMQAHHLQAVQMAMIIRESSPDEDIRRLAYDIATSQAQQAGQMYGWLEVWGLPQASREPAMTWMLLPAIDGSGHEHIESSHEPGEPMPGMATEEQLDELESLDGVPAERLFLKLMIEHHRGGVEMAEALLSRSTNEQAVSLAASIAKAQASEITYMEQLLAERAG